MTRLYQSTWRSTPKYTAQTLLQGRTHYVDDDTLRYFHARINYCDIAADGLLCCLIESISIDPHNTKRGFRYVVFDIFGTVLSRVNLDDAYKTSNKAMKELRTFIASFDAVKHTKETIKVQKKNSERDLSDLLKQVSKLKGAA